MPYQPYRVKTFESSCVIFSQGTEGNIAYILKEGSVEISAQIAGNKIVLATLEPPAIFGEMALLLGEHKRTATAIASTDCQVIEVTKEVFSDCIKNSPQIIANLLRCFAERLKATTEKAMRVPDTFVSVFHVLNLLRIHADSGFEHDQTVQALSDALRVKDEEITDVFNLLKDVNLIDIHEIDGQKMIYIPEEEVFLQGLANLKNEQNKQ